MEAAADAVVGTPVGTTVAAPVAAPGAAPVAAPVHPSARPSASGEVVVSTGAGPAPGATIVPTAVSGTRAKAAATAAVASARAENSAADPLSGFAVGVRVDGNPDAEPFYIRLTDLTTDPAMVLWDPSEKKPKGRGALMAPAILSFRLLADAEVEALPAQVRATGGLPGKSAYESGGNAWFRAAIQWLCDMWNDSVFESRIASHHRGSVATMINELNGRASTLDSSKFIEWLAGIYQEAVDDDGETGLSTGDETGDEPALGPTLESVVGPGTAVKVRTDDEGFPTTILVRADDSRELDMHTYSAGAYPGVTKKDRITKRYSNTRSAAFFCDHFGLDHSVMNNNDFSVFINELCDVSSLAAADDPNTTIFESFVAQECRGDGSIFEKGSRRPRRPCRPRRRPRRSRPPPVFTAIAGATLMSATAYLGHVRERVKSGSSQNKRKQAGVVTGKKTKVGKFN